jgi:hypothetical protein
MRSSLNSARIRRIAAITIFVLGRAGVRAADAPDLTLTNAGGTLRFSLSVANGAASYRIDCLVGAAVAPVLESSPLGLTRTDADFTSNLAFVSASAPIDVRDDYTLLAGKQRHVVSPGRERVFTLRNPTGITLTLTVRAYRDGVAFRYGFPGNSSQLFFVSGEATGFRVPAAARVWVQPYSKVDIWAPAYESNYVNGVPAGTPSPEAVGWALPLLFHTQEVWALITESDMEPSNFAIHLQPEAPGGLYQARLPEADETFGVDPQEAAVTLPWSSPWRLVIVGRQPGAIIESTLVTDLARPCALPDTAWIQPGVSSWSWWSDMSSPYDYRKLVPFVDASAKFHWPYSTIDLGWPEMQGGSIQQLAAYAQGKGVGLIVWYNSGGRHNKSPNDPNTGREPLRDVMSDPLLRDAEMARIAAMGIKGIKVDFMQSDKQAVIASYHDILRDAARHHLVVDFHGATVPRGWERTYPNLLTMEAVRGAEQYWDQDFAENAQTTDTIYVFTRNAIGPMDYTPAIFTDPGPLNPKLVPHLTTNAHELALLVVFQSGLQHVVDNAASLVRQPDFVQDYLTGLPTAWDETRFLLGSPGELAVLARRAGPTWYLAGINGLKTLQAIKVPLAFLGGGDYAMSLITDGASPREFAHTARVARAGDTLDLTLAARGGFAARLQPASGGSVSP